MSQSLEPFLLTFIQLFVAVDAIGNIPLFVSLVEGTTKRQRRTIILQTIVTATAMAVGFMLAGKFVLRYLGITTSDFQIAGGILLFVISLRLLLPGATRSFLADGHGKEVGVFPLGTPLITGPAVLTTTVMMLDSFGFLPTFCAIVVNMLLVWVSLAKADLFMKIMGASGTRAFSKIMYILLAAIGVMMVRRGLEAIFGI